MAKLRLEIVTPGGREFAGDVDSVVIPASEGEMGILPMHVPVLTALSPGELRIGNDGREERLVVGNGFAEIAVRRAREAMSDPLNTSEEQAELEVSLKRSMA